MVYTASIPLNSRGNSFDPHDITVAVAQAVRDSGLAAGVVTVFTASSTSALTTIEYEAGALADLQRALDEIAPAGRDYQHDQRWHDGNGHSHLRAALLGPSLTIPFVDARLTLGTWQQILYIDFDNKPRRRELLIQATGE